MDRLVVVLNARLEEGDKSPYTQRYFEDGGSGGFETAYAFVTQPLGVRTAGRNDDGARADDGDPLVLWRAFPDGWVLARKPTVGPPRSLLTTGKDDAPRRPSLDDMRAAVEAEESGGLLESLFGGAGSAR